MNIRKQLGKPSSAFSGFSPRSINDELRSVELVWATETLVRRNTPWGKYDEQLSLDPISVDLSRFNSGSVPLLIDHSQSVKDVVGQITSLRIENGQAIGSVVFGEDEASDAVYQKVKAGLLRSTSIGYSIAELTEVESNTDVPIYRATRWSLLEISIVAVPADPNAKIRSQENEEQTTEATDLERKTMKVKTTNPEVDLALKAERQRSTEIRNLIQEANMETSLADTYIERGLSTEDVKELVKEMEKLRSMSNTHDIKPTLRVDVGLNQQDKMQESLEDSIAQRIDSSYKPKADIRQFQGRSLLSSAEVFLGRKLGEGDGAFAKRAMSTGDFAYALANASMKAAQNRYQLAPRSYTQWVNQSTVRDYKEASLVRGGDVSSLSERLENAEYQYGSFGEEREVVQMKDWGIIHALSSRVIRNDDLAILRSIASEAGTASARLDEQLVYAQLVSNPDMGDEVELFHSSHANLGTAGAISETTVSEAFKLARQQTSVDGRDVLNIPPRYLICGPLLETSARKFLATIQPTQSSNVNPFSGLLELVVSGQITNSNYFFAADPSLIPTVTLFHLEGQEGPRIDSRINWNTDALELKISYSAVAKPMDWRGLIKNPFAG